MGPHLPNEIITIANIGADKGQKKWKLWGKSGLLNSGQNVQHLFKKNPYRDSYDKLDPFGSTVRYDTMKLCTGPV